MSKLPKSVTLEGRRYPTWGLSSRARVQLVNLQKVDEHIAELHQRLDFYSAARELCKEQLRQLLAGGQRSKKAFRYFWHIVPVSWAHRYLSHRGEVVSLRSLDSSSGYREGDRVLVYVKGYGVVGWGVVGVDTYSTQRHLSLRFRVTALSGALPAKELKKFSLRHPSRVTQRLPADADIERLLSALEANLVE